MTNPTSTSERQVRRWTVAPDRLLAWLGVVGLACYGALWVVHQAYYSEFQVSVFMVGVGQAQMLTVAAVYALWLVPPFIYPAVLIRFMFSTRLPRGTRVPVLEAAFGALLLAGIVLLFAWAAPLRDSLEPTGSLSGLFILTFFVISAGFLGFALLFKSLTDLLSFRVYPFARPIIKWWLIRRHLGTVPPTSEAVWRIYLPAR